MNLQEELDKLKVHMSIDKATIQELNTWIAEKKEGNFFVRINNVGILKFLLHDVLFSILSKNLTFSPFAHGFTGWYPINITSNEKMKYKN